MLEVDMHLLRRVLQFIPLKPHSRLLMNSPVGSAFGYVISLLEPCILRPKIIKLSSRPKVIPYLLYSGFNFAIPSAGRRTDTTGK